MNKDCRKKLTTMELYLNECISVMAGKTKAMGINMFDQDGNVLPKNIISVENFEHAVISCMYSKKAFMVNLNGTNFKAEFCSDDNGGFLYRVKPLNMEIVCNNRELDKGIFERRVLIKIGDNAEYYRYIFEKGYTLLLEHYSVSDEEKVTVRDKDNAAKSKEQLAEFAKNVISEYKKKREVGGLPIDEDEVSVQSLEEEQILDRLTDARSEVFCEDDAYEIDVYSSDLDESDDPCEVEYESQICPDGDEQEDEPYKTDLAARVEDFDYSEYINQLRASEGIVVYADEDAIQTEDFDLQQDEMHEENADDIDEDNVYDGDFEEDEDELEEEVNDEVDDELEDDDDDEPEEGVDEDLIYHSDFDVYSNGQLIEDEETQLDIIDQAIEQTMDINYLMMELLEGYGELLLETRKIRATIIARQRAINKIRLNKNSQTANSSHNTQPGNAANSDVSDESDAKNIE